MFSFFNYISFGVVSLGYFHLVDSWVWKVLISIQERYISRRRRSSTHWFPDSHFNFTYPRHSSFNFSWYGNTGQCLQVTDRLYVQRKNTNVIINREREKNLKRKEESQIYFVTNIIEIVKQKSEVEYLISAPLHWTPKVSPHLSPTILLHKQHRVSTFVLQ